MAAKARDKMPLPKPAAALSQPNHGQEMAMHRIEFAINELATVLMSCAGSKEAAQTAIANVRAAVAPVITGILSRD